MLKKVYEWTKDRIKAFSMAGELTKAQLDCKRGNYEKAFPVLEKYAEMGIVRAQDFCGDCYYRGNGTAQDVEKALNWSEKAAEQGDLASQLRCAKIYSYGSQKDLRKAENWLHTVLTSHEKVDACEIVIAHAGLFIGWAEKASQDIKMGDAERAELKKSIEEIADTWGLLL